MKKIIILMLAAFSIVGLYTTATTSVHVELVITDTQTAVDYLYANGLTKFSTTQTFMENQSLRRDEAAAFFARFARDVLGMVPDTSKTECNTFTDLHLGHNDLRGEIIASCQLGLFKGSNGKFMPTASFSNAHAVTVIVRLLNSDLDEPKNKHRATFYREFASYSGLTNGLSANHEENLDKPIKRGEVAKLILAGSIYHEQSIILGKDIANVEYQEAQGKCIWIVAPILNDTITFPLTIQGNINDPEIYGCTRRAIFENEAGHVYVQDTNGNTASDTVILQITSDPYGGYPINFSATIQSLTSTPYTNEINLKFSDNQQMDGIPYQSFILPIEIQ